MSIQVTSWCCLVLFTHPPNPPHIRVEVQLVRPKKKPPLTLLPLIEDGSSAGEQQIQNKALIQLCLEPEISPPQCSTLPLGRTELVGEMVGDGGGTA